MRDPASLPREMMSAPTGDVAAAAAAAAAAVEVAAAEAAAVTVPDSGAVGLLPKGLRRQREILPSQWVLLVACGKIVILVSYFFF